MPIRAERPPRDCTRLAARVAQVKQSEAQLACASGPVLPPNLTAADRAVDESAAATSADSAAPEDGPPEDDVPAAPAPAAVAAAPAVELAPATLESLNAAERCG